MSVKQYRADVSQSLLAISPEQAPSSTDRFTSSGAYSPDFFLLDAKNVLPTATGYTSYFGTDLDFDTIDNPPDCQDIIVYRTSTGDTLFLAMCKDGLWMKSSAGNAAVTQNITNPDVPQLNFRKEIIFDEGKCWWIKIAESEFGAANPWALWTYAIVNNKLYFYQQGLQAIVRVRGQEKGIVYVDNFAPTYIIGDTDMYIWLIHGVDSSDTCTDTKKEIIIPNAGTFTAFRLDKAHYVKNVISQWRDIFSALSTFGMDAVVNSQSHVDIDGWIAISYPPVPPGDYGNPENLGPAPGQERTVCYDVNWEGCDISTTDGRIDIPIGGVENQNWNTYTDDDQTVCQEEGWYWRYQGFSAGSPDQVPGPSRLGGMGVNADPYAELECTEVPVQAVTVNTKLEVPPFDVAGDIMLAVNYDIYANLEETDVSLGSYRWPSTYFVTEHEPDGYTGVNLLPSINQPLDEEVHKSGSVIIGFEIAAWSNVTFSAEAWAEALPQFYPIENTLRLSNAQAWLAVATPEWMSLDYPTYDGGTPGTNTNGDWTFHFPELDEYRIWSIRTDSYKNVYELRAKDWSYEEEVANPFPFKGNAWMAVQNTTGAPFNADMWIRIFGLMRYDVENPLPTTQTVACGYYLGPTLPPDDLDETTPGAVVLYSVPAGTDPVYSRAPYGVNIGRQLVSANILQVQIPIGYYIAWWVTGDIRDDESGGQYHAQTMALGIDVWQFMPSGALLGNLTDNSNEQYCYYEESALVTQSSINLLADAEPSPNPPWNITLEHNGEPGELTGTWNSGAQRLDIGGFKEFTLTEVSILNNGGVLRTFSVSSLMDSNDLFDKIASEMQAAFSAFVITPQVLTPASATINYHLTVKWMDFNQRSPTLTLDHDGDCFWQLDSTTIEQVAMAQVSGIASARGRLVAWDRENAVYTSSNANPIDFVPDIATQANVGKLQAVQGNIMQILGWKNGFVVYSTGNIVRANYTGGTYVFDYKGISDSGIIDPRHVSGNLDHHYAWTNKGLISIDAVSGSTTELTPEMLDWFSQHPFPIKVSYLNDRYVICSIVSRPPGIYSPYVRSGIEVTNNRAGTGLFTTRPVEPIALQSMPFGYNMYPVYITAMVHDIVLGKWGIAVLDFFTIFSLNPINAKGYPAEKSAGYEEANFYNESRSLAGVTADDRLVLFNDSPDDSYLCFGHTKFQVKEWSRLKQVTMEFVDYANTVIQVEPSYDGRSVNWDAVEISDQGNKAIQDFYVDIPGDWFNIVVRGTYNLRSFTVKGFPHGSI